MFPWRVLRLIKISSVFLLRPRLTLGCLRLAYTFR